MCNLILYASFAEGVGCFLLSGKQTTSVLFCLFLTRFFTLLILFFTFYCDSSLNLQVIFVSVHFMVLYLWRD